MGLNEILSKLEQKFGLVNPQLCAVPAGYYASCSGSKCEYAIGDADCDNCKGAMNYAG